MSVCKQVCIGTEAWLYSVLMLDSDTTGPALTFHPIFGPNLGVVENQPFCNYLKTHDASDGPVRFCQ